VVTFTALPDLSVAHGPRRRTFCATLGASLALLTACTTAPPPAIDSTEWHAVAIPGKSATRYRWVQKDGRGAWGAESEKSASMWRKRLAPAAAPQHVSFSWWVQDVVPGGHVAEVDREDAAARVLLAFTGDVQKLPSRTRMMFDLAEALTGEKPPYATLMYVWDATAPVGSVIVNPRSDRIRKIVVDSGTTHLRQWRQHRRDLVADFRLAFGEDPGALSSVALMSDSDNTRASARSWFGDIRFD
jgi:hypothetical protein